MTPLAQCPDRLRRLVWLVAAVLLALVAGCAPKIGDKCTVSTDCSVTGDRLCDSTQPSGYCTVFNCEPNACPDDSLCVAFKEPTCAAPAQSVRFTRTFCMATCESDAGLPRRVHLSRCHHRRGAAGIGHQPRDPQHLYGGACAAIPRPA